MNDNNNDKNIFFKSYKVPEIINYNELIVEQNQLYILNTNEIIRYDKLEKFVYETTLFYLKGKNIQYDNALHEIEFSFINSSNIYNIEYNKKYKKFPIISSLLFLNDNSNPIIFTNIDIDTYKYKDFSENNNNIAISFSKKNKQLVFDSSKYFGFLNLNTNSIYLKINVWNKDFIDSNNFYKSNNEISNTKNIIPIIIENEFIIDNLIAPLFFDNLFFDNYKYINILLINKCNSHIEKKDIIINIINNNNEYEILQNKYGILANDIYQIINISDNSDINETNRFYKSKLLNNGLSNEICYWIINESEKLNSWIDSPYPNYNNYLNIEKIPSVLSFLLFITNFWFLEINKLYNMNINFNIKDIFVTKFIKEQKDNKKYRDDCFLTLNILLNKNTEFSGGEIILNNSKISLYQGDLLIYNGKQLLNKRMISDGIKYVLVLFLEIL